jgi:hypothetical protein
MDAWPDMSQYINRSPVFKACHAPTKRKVKGTSAVLQACRKMTDLDLIENVQWPEALRRKGQCWVTIDQFQLGYGCNAIEAWLMGHPVIGGATDERIMSMLYALSGYLPIVKASESVQSIREQVEKLKTDSDFYSKAAELGADYVKRFHSMQAVADRAMEYYHEAIEKFYSRGMVYAPPAPARPIVKSGRQRSTRTKELPAIDNGEILIEYLGSSAGWVLFEVNGNKYRFSKSQPFQAINPTDANALLAMRDVARRNRREKARRPGQLLFRRANG